MGSKWSSLSLLFPYTSVNSSACFSSVTIRIGAPERLLSLRLHLQNIVLGNGIMVRPYSVP